MRIVDTISHPSMRISIFMLNEKYIIKFEAGNMEQIYKISQQESGGIEHIKNKIDEAFCNKVIRHFNDMFAELKNLITN